MALTLVFLIFPDFEELILDENKSTLKIKRTLLVVLWAYIICFQNISD